MLGDQVVESAEVVQFTGEVLQGAVRFALVRLRGGFLVAGVICEREQRRRRKRRRERERKTMVSMVTGRTALKTLW